MELKAKMHIDFITTLTAYKNAWTILTLSGFAYKAAVNVEIFG